MRHLRDLSAGVADTRTDGRTYGPSYRDAMMHKEKQWMDRLTDQQSKVKGNMHVIKQKEKEKKPSKMVYNDARDYSDSLGRGTGIHERKPVTNAMDGLTDRQPDSQTDEMDHVRAAGFKTSTTRQQSHAPCSKVTT